MELEGFQFIISCIHKRRLKVNMDQEFIRDSGKYGPIQSKHLNTIT